jgi:hypothetical protein
MKLMKELHIKIRTDLSPGKVNLHDLTCDIEYLIETKHEAVCKSIRFTEVTADWKEDSLVVDLADSRPSYACTCRTCGLNFASALKTADWCGCTEELPHVTK